MLLIEKHDSGVVINISGGVFSILAELGILIEAVQEQVADVDVFVALTDPRQRQLSKAFLEGVETYAETHASERKADSTES